MSDTPYADHRRRHTLESMRMIDASISDVVEVSGLLVDAVTVALDGGDVSLEIAGPIDDAIDVLRARWNEARGVVLGDA